MALRRRDQTRSAQGQAPLASAVRRASPVGFSPSIPGERVEAHMPSAYPRYDNGRFRSQAIDFCGLRAYQQVDIYLEDYESGLELEWGLTGDTRLECDWVWAYKQSHQLFAENR